ncbi:MAG: hypothetical protein IJ394_05220 [Bacteroidales bacterium]|nr:hypothetical protein [Bacteroidales bacterium]
MKLTLAGLIICLCATAQTMEREKNDIKALFGFCPSAAILDRIAGISIGLAFSPHWSVEGKVSVAAGILRKADSTEETDHYMEFGKEADINETGSLFTGTVSAAYWPDKSFKGAYFRLGYRCGDRDGADIRAGAGYMFRIWKMIHADISWDIDLISSCKNGVKDKDNISICISIIF